jgi:hypothetical protein
VSAQCSLLNLTANAQVGEWLKPADCKSAPPCEVRRFESFPVHQIFIARDRSHRVVTKRLLLALLAYAAIAVLAIKTLDDPRVRGVTLAVLAMFAVKTWVRRKDVLHPDGESGSE